MYMNIRYSIFILITALVVLASCGKNNDNVFKPVVSSYINVVNASADTLNFFVNGTRQNNISSLFPGSQLSYLVVPAGLQNYSFKKAGSPVVLINTPLNLQDSVYHSLYVTAGATIGSFNTVDILDTSGTKSLFAKVRFVNASPDAGNLNVSVGNSVNFNGRAYQSSSAFSLVNGGQTEIKIYLSGSAIPKVDTIIAMLPNHLYTLFSKGLLNGKGGAVFGVGLALNF